MLYQLFDTEDALAAGAAREIAGLVRRAVDARSRCTVALSGGSTPRAMHEHLAAPPLADEVRWESVELFWGDERAVPPDHVDSNYRMARETLLDPLGIDPARVHRMHGDAADLDEAARAYERELREVVADEAGGMPVLDVVLLGLGADAHTASLFPATAVVGVCDQAVVAHHVPGVGSRLTLTFPCCSPRARSSCWSRAPRRPARSRPCSGGRSTPSDGRRSACERPVSASRGWSIGRRRPARCRVPAASRMLPGRCEPWLRHPRVARLHRARQRRRASWRSSAPRATSRAASSCPRSTTSGSGGLLSDRFAVLGVSRSPLTDEEFRAKGLEHLAQCDGPQTDRAIVDWLLRAPALPCSIDAEPPARTSTSTRGSRSSSAEYGTGDNVLFYLATAPELFGPTVAAARRMPGSPTSATSRWRRVIVEKPFGHDLDSARALNAALLDVVDEQQIYRIDHYLGKETVQNILAFRFGNGIFEPVWNRRYVDHVQITAAETVGVGAARRLLRRSRARCATWCPTTCSS
jgi:6-phosphogluconolactonase